MNFDFELGKPKKGLVQLDQGKTLLGGKNNPVLIEKFIYVYRCAIKDSCMCNKFGITDSILANRLFSNFTKYSLLTFVSSGTNFYRLLFEREEESIGWFYGHLLQGSCSTCSF